VSETHPIISLHIQHSILVYIPPKMRRSRICGAIPVLPQYDFLAWCSVKSTATILPIHLRKCNTQVTKCFQSLHQYLYLFLHLFSRT